MNVIEAAKKAGFQDAEYGLHYTPGMYAYNMEIVERFAQSIRNQALEDAALLCESVQQLYNDASSGDEAAHVCIEGIRAMMAYTPPAPHEKTQPLRDVPCTCAGYQDGWHSRTCAKRCL